MIAADLNRGICHLSFFSLRLLSGTFLIIALLAVPVCSISREAVKRPNVLLVMADQWRAEAFGFAGNPDVKTPNFDALAGQSIRFSQAVASIPVCTPSRASILTGRRGLSDGMFMNDVPLDPKIPTMATVFARAGYETGFIGKWHVDGRGRSAYTPPERRHGFQYWKALECTHDYNHSLYYADTSQKLYWPGYDAEAQTADAIRYIRDHAAGPKPFFLMLSWGPPHAPYETAPERFKDMYRPESHTLTLRPNVPGKSAASARRDLAGYYAHCSALDGCMGSLKAALQAANIDSNTLVVFTSDHGDMLGSHGAEKKQQPWEESCRVPLLLRCPSRFGSTGRELSSAIATEDIAPTILGICGLKPPSGAHGRDYSRYMAGGKDPSDGAALVSCPAPFGQWDRDRGGREFRAVRTEQYTYARDLSGPWLLFDNPADPFQQHNLVDDPQHAELLKQLDATLNRKLKSIGDRFEPAGSYISKWRYRVDSTGTVPYEP